MEVYVGSVFAFGFNFAPVGWMLCQGQTIAIASNEVLFSLIGTTYGGDGVSSFAIPDLRGRVPVGTGQVAGLSNYLLGQVGGHSSLSLTAANMPAHNHPVAAPANGVVQIPVSATASSTNASSPVGTYFGVGNNHTGDSYDSAPTAGAIMGAGSQQTGATGFSQPTEIGDPFQVINYCIATEGVYPQRN